MAKELNIDTVKEQDYKNGVRKQMGTVWQFSVCSGKERLKDENGKTRGDVDFESVSPKTSFISPVPGGVGPMTITSLMLNTVELFEKNLA